MLSLHRDGNGTEKAIVSKKNTSVVSIFVTLSRKCQQIFDWVRRCVEFDKEVAGQHCQNSETIAVKSHN